jgi:hypothetical protein
MAHALLCAPNDRASLQAPCGDRDAKRRLRKACATMTRLLISARRATTVLVAIALGCALVSSASAADLAAKHPNDGGHYSAAAYICARSNSYHRQWPSLRTCMNYYLVMNVKHTKAKNFHVVELYKHYRYDQDYWNKVNALIAVYTGAFKALGKVYVSVFGTAACIGAGAANAVAGAACSIGLTSAQLYFGL